MSEDDPTKWFKHVPSQQEVLSSTFQRKLSVKDLVAIKRTQHGPGQKLCNKFIGPYKITQVKPNDTYNVEKCGNFDGPTKTSTCAEYLKPWTHK
ncbi:transposon Tf2-9 polyprotein [Trichonephila inaurata madagascariensis]|uniref:Transposon Tf2-9 polyprotein n=1 Tax=Trichonephila inaurata madagascariensis TaxID=2747483 RepID=A0A8X6YX89_9ARAC|nr:transposon Tf2-9 polyprotein [Trichonephila inaurata madagascariensis]